MTDKQKIEKLEKKIAAMQIEIDELNSEQSDININYVRKCADRLFRAIKKLDKDSLAEEDLIWLKNKKLM